MIIFSFSVFICCCFVFIDSSFYFGKFRFHAKSLCRKFGPVHFCRGKKKLCNALLFSLSGWSQIACGAELIYSIQAFGRTPLTNISPKKTLEGAFAGLSGCILITLILSKILCWPTSLLRYSACCSKLWKLTSKVQVCLHLVISYRNSTYFLFYQIGSLHLCQIRWITSSSFVDLIYRC